jgi:hypothetical protein
MAGFRILFAFRLKPEMGDSVTEGSISCRLHLFWKLGDQDVIPRKHDQIPKMKKTEMLRHA